jgi:hypothetical protein
MQGPVKKDETPRHKKDIGRGTSSVRTKDEGRKRGGHVSRG